ncbi:dynamin family protein [Archangium violaceum]|uniref:dynamin family protein n=1 Tax=Archangium violaceum TaxID=83451 RepID=UPI00193BC19A|nr:dynamin family protein [Archangium violaceum]QRK05277.1 dynamin family protein [Archangium violaceum]
MSSSPEQHLAGVAEELVAILRDAQEEELSAAGTLLHQRLRAPQCFVTVVGETSTGKSTLINSFIGRPLLPAFARPTTATVTHLVGLDTSKDRYFSIFRDATQEELERERFLELCEAPPADLLRLQVRFPPSRPEAAGLHVFDTPGFNSIVVEHEEVLRQFLPQSDLIVFVAGYRTGFGQSDQELLELVHQAREEDPELPVVLVVNRAPPGTTANDKRVREIVRNAADCLRYEPETLIIESTTAPHPSTGVARQTPALPDTEVLWSRICTMAREPRRLEAVRRHIAGLLLRLWEEGVANLEQRVALLRGGDEELRLILEQIALLQEARRRSLEAVSRSTERLGVALPSSIEWHATQMRERLERDVDASGKWLGKEDCVEWLSAHALPFEVRQAGRALETQIQEELERLDEELKQIANTAVMEIQRTVRLENDTVGRLTENLVRNLLQRLGGSAVHGLLRGVGGIGGAAAGAGNVVKMLVSRVGNLFGKTFGREVYRQIGKLFTKRVLQRINVAVNILIEVITFVVDANRWKGEVKERMGKTLESWREEVVKDVHESQLPQIHEANVGGVDTIYDSLIRDSERAIAEAESARPGEREKLEALLTRVKELRAHFNPYLSQEP